MASSWAPEGSMQLNQMTRLLLPILSIIHTSDPRRKGDFPQAGEQLSWFAQGFLGGGTFSTEMRRVPGKPRLMSSQSLFLWNSLLNWSLDYQRGSKVTPLPLPTPTPKRRSFPGGNLISKQFSVLSALWYSPVKARVMDELHSLVNLR